MQVGAPQRQPWHGPNRAKLVECKSGRETLNHASSAELSPQGSSYARKGRYACCAALPRLSAPSTPYQGKRTQARERVISQLAMCPWRYQDQIQDKTHG